ncbi:MAG: gamma carbonic anhydrase family protein [Bacteriovoracaceae bacterium]
MSLYSYKNFRPTVNESNFIAENATVIGRTVLGENANIWFQSVARGDVNEISIGDNSNIQDLCMLHVTEASPLKIGNNVSVGHQVTLHGCEVGDSCLIGMGSTLLDDCSIGEFSLVAAGSVVTPGKKFPPRSMIMGAPAKRARELTEEEVHFIGNHYKSYLGYAKEFLDPEVVVKLS